jgi:integrase/recombinase XerD
MRYSLKTRSQAVAIETARSMARPKDDSDTNELELKKIEEPISIHQASVNFIDYTKTIQLAESTIYKYRLLLKRLEEFGGREGLRFLHELDLAALDKFRSGWKYSPNSSLKQLENLRSFFNFCVDREWIEKNPAMKMKGPKRTDRPTLPFSQNDMVKILTAFGKYEKSAGISNAQRLRAFVLVLRYSGMRIGDTVNLSSSRLIGNRLFLYTQKTGTPVNCVLPEFVVGELAKSPKSSEGHFFWTGRSKLHSAIGKWQRRLQRLFELAGIEGGHAHRFRDTFAVELLSSGVPIERVSILLGHSSIKVTEKHYNPWVRSRQEQLEADLQRVLTKDPIVRMERSGQFGRTAKGTNRVHEKDRRIN